MDFMFYECKSLKSLDLSSFSFDKVSMPLCFAFCYSLKSIKFPTKKYLVADIYMMFYECWSLRSLDLSCFDFYKIEDMDSLFFGCSSLTSLDTSNLNIYSATNMAYMFYGCNELEKLDLSNWKTLYVENINSMFYDCNSLTYIDLSKLNSSSVTDMKDLFFNCIKVTSINLKNFDTSKVTDMSSMFYGCSYLQSLDLSSFNTSLVTNMKSMFYSCINIVSLDLSNFNIQKVKNMGSMFSTDKNLLFINFYNYNNTIANMKDIFYQASSDLIICINNLTNTKRITTKLFESQCIVYDCNFDLKQKQKIIFDKRICLNDCLNDKTYKYEYNNFCYDKCPTGTHLKNDGNYSCEKNINECIEKYPFLNTEVNKCIEDCTSQDFFNNKCRLNNYNIESQKILIMNIINGLEDGLLDDLLNQVQNGEREDIIKEDNGIIYQIEPSSFNRNNESKSNIILG
jgi:surface protein